MSIINGERTLGDLRKSHSTKGSFKKTLILVNQKIIKILD